MKIKSNTFTTLLLFAVTVSFVVRCLPSLIFRPYWTEYGVILLLLFAAVLFSAKTIKYYKFHFVDVFWVLTPLMFLGGNVNYKYAFYVFVTIVCYCLLRINDESIKGIKYPYIVFASITSLVTWLSFINPSYYISHILSMFPEGKSLTYSFLHRNMYHGFTNHYSRNALYLIIASMLLICIIICKFDSHKAVVYSLLAFYLVTLLLVAKRGPTLALLLAFLTLIILKEPSLQSKIKHSLRFIIIGIVSLVVAYITIPGTHNMLVRIITPNESGDYSSSRFYLWGIAWKMFLQNPILGQGWGSYLKAMEGTTFQGAHNDYLQHLAETGIVGFVFFVVRDFTALILTYCAFSKLRDSENKRSQYWITFSLLFQIFVLMYSVTGMPHIAYEMYGLYTIVCGYSVGQYQLLKKSPKPTD